MGKVNFDCGMRIVECGIKFIEYLILNRQYSIIPLDSYTINSENLSLTLVNDSCHSREGGNPEKTPQRKSWIPASAGMTKI
jgi:hypothetical protein